MRVIAGSAKGTRLFSPPGTSLRPTSDRTKQVLFDTLLSISPIPEFVVDVFAGIGSLGIEALSRGAKKAIFAENSTTAIQYLKRNLFKTHLQLKAKVILADAFVFLRRQKTTEYALVLADPPYGSQHTIKLLDLIANTSIIKEGGVLVLEESAHFAFERRESLTVIVEKKVGDTKLFFIKKGG